MYLFILFCFLLFCFVVVLEINLLFGSHHAKTCLREYADSEGPDQGLYCPLTESLDTTECMNGEEMLR